jgi:uncharacterized membrane protein
LRSLWFTPAAYGIVAVVLLLVAPIIGPLLPRELNETIGLEGVYDLLRALANTLLAVSIFSLGIMASSLQAAAATATPRARPLITGDQTARRAISTFIGGFIFAVVGIIGLSTDLYDEASRVVLFAFTILVVVAVIVALIRWIARLSRLGDVSETITLVETATRTAFCEVAREPNFHGVSAAQEPKGWTAVTSPQLGFVQSIDGAALGEPSEKTNCDLYVAARVGAYVDPRRALVLTRVPLDEDSTEKIRQAFIIGSDRTFQRDPRFGLIALSEIGSRALSSGVNDPGTAIHVVGSIVRLLAEWAELENATEADVRYPRLHVPPINIDGFRWISRDSAGLLEVQIRIQKGLATLASLDEPRFGVAAQHLSLEALERAERALALPRDFPELRDVAIGIASGPRLASNMAQS